MRKLIEFASENKHGYVGFRFDDSNRWASGKVKEDKKGKYFVSKKVKYYLNEIDQAIITE